MITKYNGWEIETDKDKVHHVNGKHFATIADAMDYASTLPAKTD